MNFRTRADFTISKINYVWAHLRKMLLCNFGKLVVLFKGINKEESARLPFL